MPDPWTTAWRLDIGVHTDKGRVRKRNEDAAKVSAEPALLAVADGIGGHRGGDLASKIAVDALHDFVGKARGWGAPPDEDLMRQAFTSANHLILEAAAWQPEYAGMGTTLTALLLLAEESMIAHIGDSRAWRIRGGAAEQLTEDHSLVAQQVREGSLTEEEAREHPGRHVLSRCLGLEGNVAVDVSRVNVQAGDTFVLASDGLVGGLDTDEIAGIVEVEAEAATASRELVQRACDSDGKDNITAVVVTCHEK